MGRMAKCRICGAKLDTTTAYKIVTNDKSAYYCSKEEHDTYEAKKKKEAEDKDKVYRLICDIIGRKEILNTALWKEKAVWNRAYTDEIIAQYLEENKEYLTNMISRLDDIEYNRIRYLSTVLRNKLGDYRPKPKEPERPIATRQEEHYETKFKPKVRKALEDFEEEFDE